MQMKYRMFNPKRNPSYDTRTPYAQTVETSGNIECLQSYSVVIATELLDTDNPSHFVAC
jgi:hypothetical protein